MLWIRPTVAFTALFSRHHQHPWGPDTTLHSWAGVGAKTQKTEAGVSGRREGDDEEECLR